MVPESEGSREAGAKGLAVMIVNGICSKWNCLG